MSTPLFKRIDTVFMPVRDLEKALDWYTKTLGFTVRWKHGSYGCLNVSETPLTLYQPESGFQPTTGGEQGHFNFYVTDIDAAHRLLTEAGAEVGEIQDPGDVKWFTFRDPDGNRLEVCWFPEG